ncbi:MAG TPA: outer membrane protein assembly factor BamE [Hyphomicrobiaceae bacterium]|jgi:outer membrane protein assembly factor BamE (lipoprotein component of BamABCDE complex)|nr:outer membrane protein assembly factor BamE [Hyphomicrobiaceae bacterium]
MRYERPAQHQPPEAGAVRVAPRRWLRAAAVGLLIALGLSACAETLTKRGHQFHDNDLKQIQPGMSQEQVKTSLGTPATTATVGSGSAYYYISSVEGQTSFFAPTVKDRQVVAIYFTSLGAVDKVAQYGLKDGKVFDYIKRETPSHARDEGILKALFRNLGTKQLGLD